MDKTLRKLLISGAAAMMFCFMMGFSTGLIKRVDVGLYGAFNLYGGIVLGMYIWKCMYPPFHDIYTKAK